AIASISVLIARVPRPQTTMRPGVRTTPGRGRLARRGLARPGALPPPTAGGATSPARRHAPPARDLRPAAAPSRPPGPRAARPPAPGRRRGPDKRPAPPGTGAAASRRPRPPPAHALSSLHREVRRRA